MKIDPTFPLVTEVTMRLLAPQGDLELPALLAYDPADPYAVSITFLPGDGPPVPWLLARDLLTEGLRADVGDGDVRLRPIPGSLNGLGHFGPRVELTLRNANGLAKFEVSSLQLEEFLDATHELVPRGAEADNLDLEGGIEWLLAG